MNHFYCFIQNKVAWLFFWNKNIHTGSYTQVTTLIKAVLVNFPNQRSLKNQFSPDKSNLFLLQGLHLISDTGVEMLTILQFLQEWFTYRIK